MRYDIAVMMISTVKTGELVDQDCLIADSVGDF
jgi:hypothetical protein